MINIHVYDEVNDAGLTIFEIAPKRLIVNYAEGDSEGGFQIEVSEELFVKAIEQFNAARKTTRPVESSAGSRKARSSEPGLEDL